MLDVPCIRHYGHRDASARLLLRRWRTRFLMGYGELLRGAWGQPYFWQALRPCRLALLAILWWGVSLGLAAAAFGSGSVPGVLLALAGAAALPLVALLARKRSLERAGYAWLMLQLSAAALLVGLFLKRAAPTAPMAAVVLQGGRAADAGRRPLWAEHQDPNIARSE